MAREAKVGLMMVAVVVGVFGFLLYKQMHRPPHAFAEQTALEERRSADDPGDSSTVDDRNPFDREPVADRRIAPRGNRNQVQQAADRVESFGDEVVEDVDPFPKENRRREKPKMPIELTSNDDDFGQFQAPRDTRVEPRRSASPEPAEFSFESTPEPQMQPPKNVDSDDSRSKPDPFLSDDSTNSVQPIQFDAPPRRERKVSIADDSNDRDSSNDFPSASTASDSFAQLDEPRRSREFGSGFESAPNGRRRTAPAVSLDDRTSSNSFQSTSSVDGPTYVIQPNDNFWSISRKRYGAGRYYKALALHNQQTISDPKMMKPGVIIATPDASVLEQKYADVIPKASSVDSVSSVSSIQSRKPADTEPAGYFVSADGAPMYRVGEQDTLTGIAKSHLGRTTRWVQILEMNRNVLRDGNELKIGMVLRLPSDASRVQVVGTPRELR